jgi:SPP1 family phage portal protein
MKLIDKPEYHFCGGIPIIEYNSNMLKMGAFENVVCLLDALNLCQSGRSDSIEQFIQAFMMFKGVDIGDEDYKTLREEGAIKVPPDGDIKYIISELNQTQTQTFIDDMTKQILLICGVPLQSDSGTSDSSNNGAMIIKNGWQQAEAKAQESEKYFEEPERRFLDIAVWISQNVGALKDLYTSNMDIRFTRRNYEDIQAKAQVLVTMLGCEKIHPLFAFEYCGMFIDPNLAYEESKAYMEELERKLAEELAKAVDESPDDDMTAQNGE